MEDLSSVFSLTSCVQYSRSFDSAVQIDNEYFQSGFGQAEYFQELEDAYRQFGVVVPLTYNDPGEEKNFVNGTVR